MPLNAKVKVSTGGIHGYGWWAIENIEEGEVIWTAGEADFDPKFIIHVDEVNKWPKEKQDDFFALAYQIDDEHYSGFPNRSEVPEDVLKENYVNHSCNGNSWYTDDHTLIANRKILKGEEICYDYALTEAHSSFRLECRCGSASCRKVITGDDWKDPTLQKAYGNHFLSHILKKISSNNQ